MRWLAHAAVTMALLACGLLLYDVMRPESPSDAAWLGGESPDPSRTTSVAPAEPETADPGAPAIDPRLAGLLARLARLEEEAARLPRSPGREAGGRTASAGGDASASAPAIDFEPERLQAFRLAMEAVERMQREEQLSRSIRSQVASLGIALRPDQEQRVVEETARLWRGQAELWRTLGPEAAVESKRQQAQAELERMRESWAQAIRGDLSAADAEKVVAHFGRGVQGIGPGSRFGPEMVRPPGVAPGVPR